MKILLMVFLLLMIEVAPTSVLSEKDLKVTSFNKKSQGNKAPRKVFIRSFGANFEVFEEAAASTSSSKKERADRTTFTSGTTTRMGVQLNGVDVDDFQKLIDEAYASFVKQLTAQGFEIMTAGEASKFDLLAEYTSYTGGTPSKAQAEGFVSVTPTGVDFLVRSMSNSGRVKSGFMDNVTKISKELGDVFVADVSFVFPFINLEADASMMTKSTSVKATIDFRVDPLVDSKENDKSGNPFAATNLLTQVRFISGNDIGSNPLFESNVVPKKAYSFEGIFKDKKIKETTQAEASTFQNTGFTQIVVVAEDKKSVASHFADCDHDGYVNAASGAMKDLIDVGVGNFLGMTKN